MLDDVSGPFEDPTEGTGIAVGLALAGGVLMGTALVMWRRARRARAAGQEKAKRLVKVRGVVTDIELEDDHEAPDGKMHYGVVTYEVAGEKYRTRTFGTSPPRHRIGEVFEVSYFPEAPQAGMIADTRLTGGELWFLLAAILGFLGVMFALGGVLAAIQVFFGL
ncbi:MAG: DUF3592 domain-containing protein [Polyangiaceae bacterium]